MTTCTVMTTSDIVRHIIVPPNESDDIRKREREPLMAQMAAAAAAASPPLSTLSHALSQKSRELRDRDRWSQREFAERLGVTQGAVSYMLAEKRRAGALDYYERL